MEHGQTDGVFFLILLLQLVVLVELGLYLTRPAWLGRLAFIPLPWRRDVVLSDAVASVVRRAEPGPASYRVKAPGAIDVAALPWPSLDDPDGDEVLVMPDLGRAVVVTRLGFLRRRGLMIVRIDVEPRSDRELSIRARVYPPLLLTMALAAPVIAFWTAQGGAPTLFVLFISIGFPIAIGLNGFIGLARIRSTAKATLDRLATAFGA